MWRLSLLVAGFVVGAAVARAEDDARSKETLPLKVTVTNEAGEPAAGVEVSIKKRLDLPAQSATTDDQGQATLNVAPKQALGLAVFADDGTNLGFVQLPWSQQSPKSLKPVTIELTPARVMQIHVVDESGNDVENATVLLQTAHREGDRASTDKQGNATLRSPHSAPRQAIIAMKPGVGLDYFAFAYEGRPISNPNLLPQSHDAPIKLVLNGFRKVTVEVVDQDDNPLAGAKVYPWLYLKPGKGEDLNMGGIADFQYVTDKSGRCTFEAPADLDRATTVWARMEGYSAPERANYDPKSLDPIVQARLVKMVTLSGNVALPEGVQGSDIRVHIVGDSHGLDSFRNPAVEVNDDGSFEVLVDRNTYYQMVARDDRKWASPAVNVVVLDEDIDGVSLRLAPATRVFGRVQVEGTGEPVPNKHLQLYQRTVQSYYELPESEKIPNPSGSNYAVNPIIGQSDQTDEDGKFEFFVGPGSYYMYGPETAERPDFVIGGETEKEVVIEVKPVEMKKDRIVKGRVLIADDKEQTVATARVFSYPLDSFSGNHIDATTDAEGQFEARQIMGPHYLHTSATFDGKKYAGMVRITPEEESYSVEIAPAAKLVGRFVDSELGVPLENREIRCAVEIKYPDGLSTSAFGGSDTTDEDGNFEIDGLVVGQTYRLRVTTKLGSDGRGQTFGYAGEVTPTKPGEFEQEFQGSALDFPPTFAPIGK